MKIGLRIFLLLIVTTLFGTAYSQRIKGYSALGMNLSQIDGDEVYGFKKIGLNGGLGAVMPFGKNNNWSFALEVIFSQQGAKQKPQYADVVVPDTAINGNDTVFINHIYNGAYKLNLNYMRVPLLLQYTDKNFITAGLGISYGVLVGIKEWEHEKLVETTTLTSGTYSRSDFDILLDLKIRIYKNIKFNVRYAYSLAKIRSRDFYNVYGEYVNSRDQFNNLFTVRLIYVFNEKEIKTAKSKKDDAGF